jgi:hypothetical protein
LKMYLHSQETAISTLGRWPARPRSRRDRTPRTPPHKIAWYNILIQRKMYTTITYEQVTSKICFNSNGLALPPHAGQKRRDGRTLQLLSPTCPSLINSCDARLENRSTRCGVQGPVGCGVWKSSAIVIVRSRDLPRKCIFVRR